MDEDYLSFSGADGATGRYLLPPMPLHSFAQAILGETFARDSARRAVGPAASWPHSTRQHPRLELLLEPELSIVCFINPRTRLPDVDALADHVTAIGDELTGVQSG